jgi:hypothetical protein
MESKKVIVIGAGASGMMAAGRAGELGVGVLLLEKTDGPGKKLLISGKERCNLTNTKPLDEFIPMYGDNGLFLYRVFHRFFREELIALLARYGVATKAERGGRLFPASDSAAHVVNAFERYLADSHVEIRLCRRVKGIMTTNCQVTGVATDSGVFPAGSVVLATGGASFPATGSSGDGYEMVKALGHSIIKLRPALVPLVVEEIERAKSMQGVSLRNVRLTSFRCRSDVIDPSLTPSYDVGRGIAGKKARRSARASARPPVIESRLGEMMLTHFGIGGPVTLLESLAVVDALEEGPVSVSIDLKPGLIITELRTRLQRDFDTYSKRSYRNILKGLLPNKMIDPFIEMTGIPPEKRGSQLCAAERERLLSLLKSLRFNIREPLPLAAAIVTAGGVSLKEIDPRTMESRLVKGLFFCGEVIDIDANTGGYNLQAAFSTGYVAGEEAAKRVMNGGYG